MQHVTAGKYVKLSYFITANEKYLDQVLARLLVISIC